MAGLAFGAEVTSNVDLGFLPEAASLLPAVTFRHRRIGSLGPRDPEGRTYYSQARQITSSVVRGSLRVRIGDLVQYSLMFDRALVLCLSTGQATMDQVRYWFLQKALPAHLLLSGRVEVLHASAVIVGGAVAAFLAPSGTGKSTLVQYFLSRGHQLVADEHVLVLAGSTTVVPSIPYLRPERTLECLGQRTDNFCNRGLPLGGLYLLERALPEAPVTLERLRGAAAAIMLCQRKQFEVNACLEIPALAHVPARRLARLAQLAAQVPVHRIHVPRSLGRLPDVYAAICADLRGQGEASAA